ncbi:MAG TPA: TonB-dependent receptor [Puia sp.]|nr:TonB-dependent receptor [Puia sp.]
MGNCLTRTAGNLLFQPFGKMAVLKPNRWVQALFWALLLCSASVFGQQKAKTITGRVTDANGQPVEGITVSIKGTSTGTSTSKDGAYSINAARGQVLIFSYVGKASQEITVGDANVINTSMKEGDAFNMNEVVVTGYMTQKKADLTGAISVVSTKDLTKNHGSTNVLEALQGVVPGMHITTDGSPVGNIGVQIRGLTSVNGASPLIVIDGVPSYMNLRDMNGDNIASIQVLKDAASASIYGAQGAAGVILIETKKGVSGPAKVTYNGSFGISSFMNKVKMMNTQQYGQALWQAAVNDGRDPNAATQIYTFDWHTDAGGIPRLDKVTPRKYLNADSTMIAGNTNWLDAISQLGLQNNHQITISGGNDRATSLLSFNFFQNQGTQIYTGYKRFSLRVNTSYRALNNHLVIGENMEASRLKINDQNVMHDALVEPPIIPVHTTNGGWGGSAVALGMDDYWNPVRELTLNKDNGNNYNKIYGNAFVNLSFLKHFTARSQLGLIYTDGYHRTIQFTFQEGGGKFNPISSVDQWYWTESTLDLTNTLSYKLSTGKHSLDAIAGMEATKYQTETVDANRQTIQFQNYDYAYVGNATGNMNLTGGGNKYNALSYFGKFNYAFDSKYLLSASLRYDGSSKFGINNQYGLFPAVSAGWRISDENFMKSVTAVSDLKLRASWGKNGNSNIPTGATETYFVADYNGTSYGIGGNETGSNPSGYRRVQTGNPNLKWETTTQIDGGVDFGLFERHLVGSLDYYHKHTTGMLFQPPYLGTIGEGGYQWVNAADMSNNGIELEIGYQSNMNRKFTWSIHGNIAHNSNKITNLPKTVQYSYGGSALKGDDIQGHPLDSYYGFVTQGLFTSQDEVNNSATQPGKGLGRIRYKDISGAGGKPDGNIDYDYDRTWIGSWDPKVEYGISFTANYKNWDFFMFWQGVAGNTVYDGWKSYSDFYNVWVQNGFNHPTRVLDAWSLANPKSKIPALSLINPNDELRMSTYFMESGSYLKLRNVQVGYTFPKKLTSSMGIEKMHFYVTAQNLIMLKKWWGDNKFTGPDPENPDGSSYSNPYVRPQIFKVGVEVGF